MAVSNNLYTPTEDLISTHPRRCFRTGIRWQHWQLRSLIGTDGQNYIYFPVPGTDNRSCHVLRLNTKTRETETVKRLSFNPRCLVARNGWVCCGGEGGIFSGFRVAERSTPVETNSRFGPEGIVRADSPIPMALDLSEATLTSVAEARLEKSLVAQSTTFGKERVNCITLWFPPTLVEPSEGTYDQGVAVLAHNDKTVIVVGLRDQEALDKITYPEFMNRGVISPDGRLLIAISDDPYLYVHERKEKKSGTGTSVRVADQPVYEWNLCGRIQLKSQSKDDRSESRGSFAASFSGTGRYLAVGTQYGTISIFNVACLTRPGVNALVTSFDASRPNEEFGAVRDMAFSPGPTDLLAWTEDRGRVGVADLRTRFDSRQVLYLDKEDDFEHLTVTDRGTIDPRLLEQRAERSETLLSTFANAIESSAESRQNRQEGQPSLARYNIPLTPEETAVLEAIQDFRRRQDQYNAPANRTGAESGSSSNGNGNSNGNSNGSGSGPGSRPPWAAERATRDPARTREHTANVSRAVSEILDNIRDQRERVRDTQERLRAREDNTAERRRAAYLMREWEDNPTRRFLGTFMTSRTRPGSFDTAGLSWSENGDLLFVGAENGIYEFSVNSLGRRLSPSITLS